MTYPFGAKVKFAVGAGHGGFGVTPGKRTPDNEYEWHFNNTILLGFVDEINKYQNVEILRLDDPTGRTDVPLATRVAKANNWGADAYFSFHNNASTGRWGNWGGTETYYFVGSKIGKELAEVVQKAQIDTLGLRDRGIKRGNHLYVVKNSKMPCVLLETAFMDSMIDIRVLRDRGKLELVGRNVAKAVAEYSGLKLKSGSKTTVSPAKSKPAPKPQVKSETVSKSKSAPKPASKPSTSKWTKINGKWTGQSLFKWQYGQPVEEMQKMLSENNPPFYPNKGAKNNGIDSYFGDQTENQVRRFQTYYKLKVDGIPGKEVYNQVTKNKVKKVTKPTTVKPKATKKQTVTLPASAKTWRTYKLNVQPVAKNSDWSLTPSRYGGLTYTILGRPYPDVVTINTSKGRRNIYVGKGTGAVIK